MHQGQGNFLPRHVDNFPNITNYDALDDNAREHLHLQLTAVMNLRDTVVPSCLVKIGSCYHRNIYVRTDSGNKTYPPRFFYHGLGQIVNILFTSNAAGEVAKTEAIRFAARFLGEEDQHYGGNLLNKRGRGMYIIMIKTQLQSKYVLLFIFSTH